MLHLQKHRSKIKIDRLTINKMKLSYHRNYAEVEIQKQPELLS